MFFPLTLILDDYVIKSANSSDKTSFEQLINLFLRSSITLSCLFASTISANLPVELNSNSNEFTFRTLYNWKV